MNHKEIVLAGGCFWGTQAYLKQLPGVLETYTAYANSKTKNPTYKEVSYGQSHAAEAVYVKYDESIIDLPHLLHYFFQTIDPTSYNKQGNDVGVQYRSGIYFIDSRDEAIIRDFIAKEQPKFSAPIRVEVKKLENLTKAEEYHQDYLDKNPGGYCHVTFDSLPKKGEKLSDKPKTPSFEKPSKEALKKLSPLSFDVTQNSATERAFSSPLNSEKREGIYIDIASGEPLFSSKDKFDSGSGWPSFVKPINPALLQEVQDRSYGMNRTEVRAKLSDSHLGHVFPDGPRDRGGMRYCINGAALEFILKEEMESRGYGAWLKELEK